MTDWVNHSIGIFGVDTIWVGVSLAVLVNCLVAHYRRRKEDKEWEKNYGQKGRKELAEFLHRQNEQS